jgi:hypothetical protein
MKNNLALKAYFSFLFPERWPIIVKEAYAVGLLATVLWNSLMVL